jgi:hypothetical protein
MYGRNETLRKGVKKYERGITLFTSLEAALAKSFRIEGVPHVEAPRISSCYPQGENPGRYTRFQVIILEKIIFTSSFFY